ncbi:hypothetical protein [Rhizobium brockwellii]|uniref:hypothetical protein n=1 Tax=Rhizobium brockwellii TaxID=3019932 RepID=UPI0005230AE0|nr:hypothetical protein [Rhizobium brockwellii]KPN22687.1 hypothetical protein KS05_31895 [Rhizobium brockwellii]QJX09994.1 hypothetical protein RLCC275e_34035 [Rhizobium brockwellii]
MKNWTVLISLSAYLSASAVAMYASPTAAACGSGPDYCTDDPRIPAKLASKKNALAGEYPTRLISLLDRGVQCVARIQQSPNGFSLVIVKKGQIDVLAWDEDNETATKAEMAAGTVDHYWIVNSRRAFSCDGQASYDQQPDYVAADDVNSSLALKCGNGGSC